MISKSAISAKNYNTGERIVAIIPYIKQKIPIIILFRALRIVFDYDILNRLWFQRFWDDKDDKIIFRWDFRYARAEYYFKFHWR